jgi:hypothetical protein
MLGMFDMEKQHPKENYHTRIEMHFQVSTIVHVRERILVIPRSTIILCSRLFKT